MSDNTPTPAPSPRRRLPLGMTLGQWETIALAVVLAVVLLVTTLPHLTGNDSSDTAGTSNGGATTGDSSITDVAQGITDTSIKVGVVLLDLSGATSLGLGLPNFSTDLQQTQFQSLIDQVNAAGGINGRQIDPVYAVRDALATTGKNSDQAICINLAKDQKVFAVIGFTYAAGECAATQYHLPVVTKLGSLDAVYQQAGGLLVTQDPSQEQNARNWATVLVKQGVLTGHKVGMVAEADKSMYQLSGEAAADTLQKAGQPLTDAAYLDPTNVLADLPPLIQKMKSEGVDEVMLSCDFSTALRFIALSEAQHYTPHYLTSDLNSLASNGLLAQAGASLDGAIGYTDGFLESEPETPSQTTCRENYNDNNGTAKDVPAGVQNALQLVCGDFEIFQKGVRAAGKNLNPRTFIQGVENLGDLANDLPSVLPGAFGPGKTTYSDELRPVIWSAATHSYSVDGDPVSVK